MRKSKGKENYNNYPLALHNLGSIVGTRPNE
ncbi:MAG: hypothetical protein ACJAV5_001337 [Vicingaceae bacterium]|jgi:hypothetical protein